MKRYLGDSVYAELEGGMIKLTTDNGFGPSNTIYLEWETFTALIAFSQKVYSMKINMTAVEPEREEIE